MKVVRKKPAKRVIVSITLPQAIKEQLDELAWATRRTRGVCVELALERFLKEQRN